MTLMHSSCLFAKHAIPLGSVFKGETVSDMKLGSILRTGRVREEGANTDARGSGPLLMVNALLTIAPMGNLSMKPP